MKSYDAIIVGARCAGAATAMLLARAGCSVLVVDKSAPGRDTLSTHAIMRGGVYQLAQWGLLDRLIEAGTPRIERTTFHYGDATFPVDIPPKHRTDALYAPRRTVLDPILVDAAREAGAEVVYGTRFVDLLRDAGGRVCGIVCQEDGGKERRFSAPIVIGADGARSKVAALVGAEAYESFESATATIYSYWRDLDFDGFHWMYDVGCAAGVIPTNDGETCVFVAMPAPRVPLGGGAQALAAFERMLREAAPRHAERILAGRRVGGLKTVVGLRSHLRQCWGPGWALVGDAGYFKDPLTAHGITDALRDAELLARAILAGGDDASMRRYESIRDDLSLNLFALTERVAAMDWSLTELQQIHKELSRAMQREVEVMVALNAAAEAADDVADLCYAS